MEIFEEVTVTIEMVCKADPYVQLVLNLAKCVSGGNAYQHYSLFKDLLDEHVGWHIQKDEPPHPNYARKRVEWWMRSQAAYDVAIEAVCHELNIDVAVSANTAQRKVVV